RRAVHRHARPLRQDRGNHRVVRAGRGRRVRPPAGAGVLHGRRYRTGRGARPPAREDELMATPNASAPARDRLHVLVISPEQTVYDDQADSVVVPAWDGELGVLRGHAPLMAVLGSGVMRVIHGGTTE